LLQDGKVQFMLEHPIYSIPTDFIFHSSPNGFTTIHQTTDIGKELEKGFSFTSQTCTLRVLHSES
jgi:hypothetical protein